MEVDTLRFVGRSTNPIGQADSDVGIRSSSHCSQFPGVNERWHSAPVPRPVPVVRYGETVSRLACVGVRPDGVSPYRRFGPCSTRAVLDCSTSQRSDAIGLAWRYVPRATRAHSEPNRTERPCDPAAVHAFRERVSGAPEQASIPFGSEFLRVNNFSKIFLEISLTYLCIIP